MGLTQILLLVGAALVIVCLGVAWVLRERLGAYLQLHRWPKAEDLAAYKAERARRRGVTRNLATAKRSLREAQRAQEGRVKAGEHQVQLAKKTRDHAIARAQADVAAAERIHATNVQAAEQRLALWQSPGSGPKLGSYKDVTVFQHQIRTAQGASATLGTKATVDTAGNLAVTKRVTLTRVLALGVVGGLLFKKKDKDDTRELYLLVETPEFASVTKCDPNEGPKVRQLAAKINTAALQANQFKEQRPSQIERYRNELSAVQQDQIEIDTAKLRLHQVESDPQLTSGIEIALRALTATLGDTGQSEAAKAKLSEVMLLAVPGKKPADMSPVASK